MLGFLKCAFSSLLLFCQRILLGLGGNRDLGNGAWLLRPLFLRSGDNRLLLKGLDLLC